MGFFSFLTRKSSSDKNQNRIKGQSYKSTVASIPPIQGTYPVAGNGPNVLDQLQQAARKRSQAQLSVIDHDIDLDPAAPPPMVPRFRSFSPGRPTTAPNQSHANSLSSRPRSVARSIRSTNSAWSVPEKTRAAAVVRTVERPPPVPSIPSHHRRESSIDSFQDGSRFVDVLDAQGEIRPSNFRSRVAATGAREYGEDVAERNIGENGLNLNSPAVKAFYRLSSSGRLTLQTSDSGGLSIHDSDGFDDDDDDCAPPPPSIPHLDLGTIREASRPTSSSTAWRSFSGSIGGEMLRSSKSQRRLDKRPETSSQTAASLKNRRRSFNAFASTTPEPRTSKPRPLSLHPSLSNFNYSAPLSPPPMPKSRPKTSEGRSRQRSIGMVEIESLVDEAFDTPAPCPTIPVRFKQTEHSSYSRPDSHLSRQDLILPRHDPPIPRHDPLVPHDSSHIRPDTHHGPPTLSLYPRSDISQPSRPSSSSSMDKPPRNRSIGGASLLRHQRLDNITEHIPVRTSSLTLQSQPCITPTTMSSGYSSNPFPKSMGQHTPSTSIDASLPPSIKINHEREQSGGMTALGNQNNYYNAAEDDFSADTLVPSRRELEQDLSHPINAGVEAEYYISDASEDSVDSFIAWKEKRRGEEGLLYKEDYGIAGGGLPGLFEPLPIPKAPAEPPAPIKPPKTPKSPKRPTTRGTTKSNKSTPRKTRHQQHLRRSRTSTLSPPRREPRNGSSSDDEGSDSFWERARDMPHGPSFVSLAELGIDLRHLGLDQYGLTEDDDAKVDIHTAVKLRKEMRRRKMETQSRRHTRSYADEGDVED